MSIKNAKVMPEQQKKMVQPQAKNTFVNTSRELQDPSVLWDRGKIKLNFAL